MDAPVLTARDLVELADQGLLTRFAGVARDVPALVVDLAGEAAGPDGAPLELAALPSVVIGVGDRQAAAATLVDVVVPEMTEADRLVTTIARHPLASTSLAMLLRHGDERDIGAGLIAESTTYSMLQAGPEFAAWRASRPPPSDAVTDDDERVRLTTEGETLTITLSRPRRHNALDTRQLEAIVDALTDAVGLVVGRQASHVVIGADGPSFSSGGDIAEFGAFPDPANAHAIRLTRSAGRLIAQIADRVEVRLHGWCLGAGIELPAFAATVVADPATTIGLPEIELGLIPGAGGTVSLPRRIGRHRTALLALTGRHIDAATALEWGLVDHIQPVATPK